MNQLAKTFTCGARGSSLGTLRVRSTGLVVSSHNARPSSGLAHGTDVTNPSTMLPRSFVDVPHASHFPLQNLPYGVFSTHSSPKKRIGVAIGSSVIDLSALSDAGLLNGPHLHKAVCFHDVRADMYRDGPTDPPTTPVLSQQQPMVSRVHSMHSWPWGGLHGQRPAQP